MDTQLSAQGSSRIRDPTPSLRTRCERIVTLDVDATMSILRPNEFISGEVGIDLCLASLSRYYWWKMILETLS